MRSLVLLALFAAPSLAVAADETPARPNILWLYLEDVSGWFGYTDDPVATHYNLTPNIDGLAASGQRLDRFYTTAGVCSATRSAVITGMYQTSIGAHQHRSSRPLKFKTGVKDKSLAGTIIDPITLPDHIRLLPQYFRQAGYYTFNEGGGKDDFNFLWNPEEVYDHRDMKWNFKGATGGSEWSGRTEGQPFFGQIQIAGGKQKLGRGEWAEMDAEPVDRSLVSVPPYYPDIDLVREEIGHHYDCIRYVDWQIGQILEALERDGLRDNTYLLLLSDHGYRMHRHKQFLYEGGIHMPGLIVGPGIEPAVRDDLALSIDFGPTSLALAGLEIPDHMEGVDLLADDYEPRDYIVAARDRCDYTIEQIRAVITPGFKYLRNGLTDRPYMQASYKDPWPITQRLRAMAAAGEMTAVQMAWFDVSGTAPFKPAEELYDLAADPHEINNLADDPEYADVLVTYRGHLDEWIETTGDAGQQPESAEGLKAALLRWGDKAVNPEYDAVRDEVKAMRQQWSK